MRIGIFFDHLAEAARQTGLPLAEIAARAAACGVTRVDADPARLAEDPDGYLGPLAGTGIAVGCLDVRVDFAHGRDARAAEDIVRLAGVRGIGDVLMIPGFVLPGDDETEIRARIAEGLNRLLPLAESEGVRLSLEDYDSADSPYATAEAMTDFMERVPGLACAFDTGNFLYAGEDALQALSPLLPRIRLLHCKDRALKPRPGDRGQRTPDGRMLYAAPAGRGVIPMAEILRRVRRAGFDGTLTIEHYGSPDMLGDMAASAEFIRSVWEERQA